MIPLGFFTFVLLATRGFSAPVPIEQSPADAKVMKCVVEVISDTLSKPSPLPVSQHCMEILRGDERIISVLRHQNLLRELQELAAKGTNEKALRKKQSNDYKDILSVALESHIDKKISSADKLHEIPTEKQQGSSGEIFRMKDKEFQDSKEETPPNVSRHSFLNMKDTTPFSSDMATEKEDIKRQEPRKHGTSEIESTVEQSQDQSQSEEHSPEESEPNEDGDTQEEEMDEDQIKESNEEDEVENHSDYSDSKDEEPSEDDGGDGRNMEESRNQPENSEPSDVKMDGTSSEEEIRPNGNTMIHQNSEDEGREEDEDSNISDENYGSSKEELQERKKWKMTGELSPEQNHVEISDEKQDLFEGNGKLAGSGSAKAHNEPSHFQHSWGNRRSHSGEDIRQKGKETISSYPVRKRVEDENKKEKEEEGSANRKNEEQEMENLEAIESELEAMAQRLHQMRRN
ncbi:chromogranin-A isoform X1 [Chiloscyllium punctatum]|uniref:Chromogranin-A n=1 Tax=Chiloscyllium punctatum TaxID=137246 RepID=A0A401SAN5_CHIPU|nr:hypothetical protein [Chiloscyllium punctatum]